MATSATGAARACLEGMVRRFLVPIKLALALQFAFLHGCGSEELTTPEPPTSEEMSAVTGSDPTRRWHPVTGILRDIATGNGPSSRWGIDTNCNDAAGGCRIVRWSGSGWVPTTGRGHRIALRRNSNGAYFPWVVNAQYMIFRATDTLGGN